MECKSVGVSLRSAVPDRASPSSLSGDQSGTTRYARGENDLRACARHARSLQPAYRRDLRRCLTATLLGVKWSQVQTLSACQPDRQKWHLPVMRSVDGSRNSELATILGAVQQAVQQPSAIATAPLGEPDA